MNWYALYTAARAEKQVEIRLKSQGLDVYLPVHKRPRKWSDRIKMVEMPLFPSYIFVRTSDEILRQLVRTYGVSRIVFYNGSPAIIRQSEIDAIREFVQLADEKDCSFDISEEVRIACGPLKDISGKIKKIGKKYMVLHIEQMGLTVCVEHNQVVKENRIA